MKSLRPFFFALIKKNIFFFTWSETHFLFIKSVVIFFSKFQTTIKSSEQAFKSNLLVKKLGLILLKHRSWKLKANIKE